MEFILHSKDIFYKFLFYAVLMLVSSYTVFYRIHAPAQKPKCKEGRLYSGLIRSKSNDVGRLWGFPNCQFHF